MSFPRQVPLLYKLGHDLETRLGGSVFMYKDVPYKMVYEQGEIFTVDIVSGSRGPTLKTDDPDLDISSIEVGYLNCYGAGCRGSGLPERSAVYLTRVPSKQWRQGIHPSNVQVYSTNGLYTDWSKDRLVYSRGFAEMAMGIFPPLSVSLDLKAGESVALSKDMALMKSEFEAIGVYYRCKPVGYFDKRGARFTPTDTLPEWFVDEVYKNMNGAR